MYIYLIPVMQLNVHWCIFRCSMGMFCTSNKHNTLIQVQSHMVIESLLYMHNYVCYNYYIDTEIITYIAHSYVCCSIILMHPPIHRITTILLLYKQTS